jgi:hypothetical protein
MMKEHILEHYNRSLMFTFGNLTINSRKDEEKQI